MVTVNINGRQIQANEGKTILDVARENNINIPTLCYHESVEAYGACRLCVVEMSRRGRSRIVASCLYPVEEGIEVQTHSPRVLHVRRTVVELLLARCPDSDVLQKLAKELAIPTERFVKETDNKKCILCALCTRACREIVGVSAISLVNRGTEREMSTPFSEFSEACVACGSCAEICPTGAISIEDAGDTRTITMPNVTMEFKLKKCSSCGRYWAPERQLEYIIKKAELPADAYEKCPDCRD
jgi:bidirectional [NiFe] hydrogenase diaphorase subunit